MNLRTTWSRASRMMASIMSVNKKPDFNTERRDRKENKETQSKLCLKTQYETIEKMQIPL